ncbi:MAG: YraN family protein [Acidobacteria bacterium]|nr:YraN family protein [Acidobacteriota bacterium]
MTLQRRLRGLTGEDVAAAWYQAHGYEVVARNWRCRRGELDLIVRNGATFVFCEVKSRRTDAFGSPAEAITHEKRQRVRHLAAAWIQDSKVRPATIRFDVAAILGDELQILEGAF